MEEEKKEVVDEQEVVTPQEEPKEGEKKHGKLYKIINIILDVLFVSFAVFAISAIIFRNTTNNSKDGNSINGYQLRTVETGSMAENNHIDPETYKSYSIKTLPVHTLINIQEVTTKNQESFYEKLAVGDVVTFVYYTSINGKLGQYVYTHRLIEKTMTASEGYKLVLMGDAETPSGGTQTIYTDPLTAEHSLSYVLGKVVWANHGAGEVITFLKSKTAILFLVIIPCSVLFLYEVGKIIYVVTKEKKQKDAIKAGEKQAELESNQAEIENLKAQLAALQNKEQEQATKVEEQEVDKKEE